jgi:hypothetical protein
MSRGEDGDADEIAMMASARITYGVGWQKFLEPMKEVPLHCIKYARR